MAKKNADSAGELWERMPGESVKNYEYFCAYRDMRYIPAANADDVPKLDFSRVRSIRRIAEQLNKSKQTIGDLSSRFNWSARCDAYDLYILRRQRDKNEMKILKMRENHAAIGEQLLKRALRRMLTLKDDEIEAGDVVRMIDIGVKVERLSRGETATDGNGRSSHKPEQSENNLLDILTHSTGKDISTDDIPELQQTTDSDSDVVEPSQLPES